MAAEAGDAGARTSSSTEACGVPATPVLRLRLPAGQRLSSVIWKDGLNRTIHVESSASLAAAADAAAAAGSDSWTTAAVALPAQHPIEESSGELAPSCSGSAACQQAQRQYWALVLAPDGRHSSVVVQLAPGNLIAHQISLRYKHYEPNQLTHEQGSLLLPHPGAASLSGVALFDSPGTPLQLARAGSAVVSGSSLPDTRCSRQWSLSTMLRVNQDTLQAAGEAQVGGFRGGGQRCAGSAAHYAVYSFHPECLISASHSLPRRTAGCCCLWMAASPLSAWAPPSCRPQPLLPLPCGWGGARPAAAWRCPAPSAGSKASTWC